MKLTKNQKIGITSGLLLTGIIAAIIRNRKNKKNAKASSSDGPDYVPDDAGENILPVKVPVVPEFPLNYGSRGENVKKLQTWLNSQASVIAKKYIGINFPFLKNDGIFGKKTLEAVRIAFKTDEISKDIFQKNKM